MLYNTNQASKLSQSNILKQHSRGISQPAGLTNIALYFSFDATSAVAGGISANVSSLATFDSTDYTFKDMADLLSYCYIEGRVEDTWKKSLLPIRPSHSLLQVLSTKDARKKLFKIGTSHPLDTQDGVVDMIKVSAKLWREYG